LLFPTITDILPLVPDELSPLLNINDPDELPLTLPLEISIDPLEDEADIEEIAIFEDPIIFTSPPCFASTSG